MFCPTCGFPLEAGVAFCGNCGTAVKQQEPAAPTPPFFSNSPAQEPPMDLSNPTTFSTASGQDLPYVVLQVTLKEKFLGTGSGNLVELERAINEQAAKGYRLHTIATSGSDSKGLLGGDRIQATLVFEKIT